MNSDLVNRIADDLVNYRVPGVDVIIAGIDERFGNPAASLYMITDDWHEGLLVSCQDSIGFAAIGSGARHAESQFMLSRYSNQTLDVDALVQLYLAKKSSEVAPGVGPETDLYVIGAGLGTSQKLEGEILDKLESEHKKIRRADERARARARKEMNRYVREEFAKAQPQAQTQPTSAETKGTENKSAT